MFKKELTIGEVAQRSGVAVSALHFYESKGLISSRRNRGNQRRYARDVLRRVALIKVAQTLGLSLAEIQGALQQLPEDRSAEQADWERLAHYWRHDLESRIRRLQQLKDQLTSCIGCGCLSVRDCPLRNPGDHLRERGAGPHLLEPPGA